MLDTDWSDSLRGAFRVELRAEAIGLAGRGWPVLPGTYPADEDTGATGSEAAGRIGSSGEWTRPTPIHPDWWDRLAIHPDEVAALWTPCPYSLLVATGTVLDAVEVDGDVGKRAACLLRATGHPAPIVAMPDGRWLFLTTVADGLPVQLELSSDVQWHGLGSWIPLPPTPFRHGVVHWRVKPDVWGWHLPAAHDVHDVLVRALDGAHRGQPLAVAESTAA